MKHSALQQAVNYNRARKRKKLWYQIVSCMAAVVVFITAYALMLPAITEKTETFCGLDEHHHDESCYTTVNACLTHEHDEGCTEIQKKLICPLEEITPHVHNEQCYSVHETLVCTTEESEAHTHDDSCFCLTQELICTTAETEGHIHGDACYTEETTIICDLDAEHVHVDACNVYQLTCGKEEHTHSLQCRSDPSADVETAEVWERNLPKQLDGSYASDLLAVAKSQLGYRESERNYLVRDDGTKMGYTRYGQWYGDLYADWSAMYVSFCLEYANVEAFPHESDSGRWVEALNSKNLYKPASDYNPKQGDLIFFDADGDAVADRVGIVDSLKNGISAIEGDRSDQVTRGKYDPLDPTILGYGQLPESQKAATLRGLEGNYTNVNSANRLKSAINGGTSHIRLSANISMSNVLTLPNNANVVLDLNGYTLTYTGRSTFLTVNSGTFTLWDSQAKTETLAEASGDLYGRTAVLSNKTLTYYVTETAVTDAASGLTEETLRQHTVTAAGAIKAGSQPLFTVNGGTLNVEGGMIYGGTNRAIMLNKGTVNLNGGYLCGFTKSYSTNTNTSGANPANEFGAAIYVADGELNCSGTVIAANDAASGGAICLGGGKMNITGGAIAGNKAMSERESYDTASEYNGGGAIYAHESAVVEMSGGYLTNNTVVSDDSYWDGGGAIFLDDSANFTLSGGYLTGNIAHGGGAVRTGWYSKSLFTMSGGFLSGNVARKAEGGALFLGMEEGGADDVGGAVITAGYVTNNKILVTEHWGGGGLFCSDGASLSVQNMLVTQNTSAGFGGGLAGCSTGHIFLYSTDGCAIYENEDCIEGEPHFSGDASDKPYDKQICDETFQSYDHSDYFCALESAISGDMLGGHAANWTGSADGIAVNTGVDDVVTAEVVMGLKAHPTQEAIEAAQEKATLFVTGNHSDTHGGGILCNGILKIGGPQDLEVPVRLLPSITKLLVDGNGEQLSLEGFSFTAVITDEFGNTVCTAKSQADGTFRFDKEIVLTREGVFTYYLKEQNDGKYDDIQYDTSTYRITVNVIKGEPIAIDSESTKVYYYTTSVTMDRKTSDGSWQTICTINGEYCGSVVLPLFDDAYAFTNILADTTSIRAVKKWNGEQREASVEVILLRNGVEIDWQVLSDSNDWSHVWRDLPLKDAQGEPYSYHVRETAIPGYSVQYVTSVGGSETAVYWVPATQLTEGEKYVIVNAAGDKALYATDDSIDAAYTTADQVSVSVQKGSLSVDGKTYTTYLTGDIDSRAVFTAVVPSDLSKKDWNNCLTLQSNGTSSSSWMLVQDAGGNYLKGTNNVTYCSAFVIENGMLKGHDGFEWTPDNLRTVVYSGQKFTTATATTDAAMIFRKVVTLSVDNIQTVTIVNTPFEDVRYTVEVTKTSSADDSPLEGVELEVHDEQGNPLYFVGNDGIYTLSDSTNPDATTKLVTEERGKLLIQGLPEGDYVLHETKTVGEHDLMEDYPFELGQDDPELILELTLQSKFNGYIMPETGGSGTDWYTLGGMLLIAGSAFLLYKQNKRRKEDCASS